MEEVYRTRHRSPGWGLGLVFVAVSLLLAATVASVVAEVMPQTLSEGVRVGLPAAVLFVLLLVGQAWMYRALTGRQVRVCASCGTDLDPRWRVCVGCGRDIWEREG